MRNRVDMQKQKPEAMSDYYLEKMLSNSAQFRAYNEIHQGQQQTKRVQELQIRQEKLDRLRALQKDQNANPVVEAIFTLFGVKKSA
ncbi:MAG TPA: hypothetical protein V6C89_01295 [Drouetiella sp.]